MFFRNITLFRFPASVRARLDDLDLALAEHPLRPLGPLEMVTRGFVSPFGRESEVFAHGLATYRLFTLGMEDKLLPSATVQQALGERIAKQSAGRERPVSGRERKRLKDEVLAELLPRALARPSRIAGYLDLDQGWLLVDSASRKAAETLVSELRNALGSFPAMHAEAEESPRALMTEWLIDSGLPNGFALGDECELKDPVDRGAVVRCRRQELASDEVREHLKSGKQVTQLALIWNERMRFVLDENLVLRKFKLLDVTTEAIEHDRQDSAAAELDARFALFSHELKPLLEELERIFVVPRPQGG